MLRHRKYYRFATNYRLGADSDSVASPIRTLSGAKRTLSGPARPSRARLAVKQSPLTKPAEIDIRTIDLRCFAAGCVGAYR
jgi:hypothetical protein